MTARMSPARRAAFLAALRQTGNQTLAAERAKVSRSWVGLHRANDPAFDAAVREALRQAQDRLRTDPLPNPSPSEGRGGSCKPPPRWAAQDGEELVVTGGAGGPRRIARARLRQWTPRIEARFCAALRACCNVRHACRAVGLSPASAYRHRERWPGFAAEWDAAVREGWENVQQSLTAAAIALLDPEIDEGPPELGPMNVGQAIQVVGLHMRRATGAGKWAGARRVVGNEG